MSFSIKDLLTMEVVPALGCTEPVAVALGVASAASLLAGETVQAVEVWVDPNVYKNGIAVSIPGTGGLCGLDLAAAIGAVGGDPHLRLQVLEPVDDQVVAQAQQLLKAKRVKVNLLPDQRGLLVRSIVKAGNAKAESVIQDVHDNIVCLILNDNEVLDSPLLSKTASPEDEGDLAGMEEWLKGLSLAQLFELLDDLDVDDLVFLKDGVDTNLRLAEYGLKHGSGLGIGKGLERLARQKFIMKDMILAARILTSAASDARMAGVKLPAMSSAGSGNHGLIATLPIWAVKDYVTCDEETVLKSIGLSHTITAYVKAYTGRLSAVCGCSIAAGAGAAAGVAYLLGGDLYHVAGAIKNLTEDLAGVICDGAKASCSLKLATAAGTAVQAALFSLHGVQVQPTDGIIGISPEKTMQNLGVLSTEGMIETDRAILRIMLEKQFSHV